MFEIISWCIGKVLVKNKKKYYFSYYEIQVACVFNVHSTTIIVIAKLKNRIWGRGCCASIGLWILPT